MGKPGSDVSGTGNKKGGWQENIPRQTLQGGGEHDLVWGGVVGGGGGGWGGVFLGGGGGVGLGGGVGGNCRTRKTVKHPRFLREKDSIQGKQKTS